MKSAVLQFLAGHEELLSRSQPVFAGFSGGIDSTALVLALQATGISFTAVHFDHHIRGEASAADADWCRRFCLTRGIAFRKVDLFVPDERWSGEGIEAAARRLRLNAWNTLAGTEEAVVFLAHHADDCLENLFLRLARGGNASGLLGLSEVKNIGNLVLCRPFLKIRKESLREYLLEEGIADWRTDATNDDNTYRRNAVRNGLLPWWRQTFGHDEGLLRSLDALRMDADFIEAQADEAIRRILEPDSTAADWQLHPAIFARVLRGWLALQHSATADLPVSRQTIERVRSELTAVGKTSSEKHVPIESGLILGISSRGVRVVRGVPGAAGWGPVCWNFERNPVCAISELGVEFRAIQGGTGKTNDGEVFAMEEFHGKHCLEIRARRPGDAMIPFGAHFSRKLQDIMVDAKIPAECRSSVPIVVFENTIIWIPGVRRAEFGRVMPDTERTVRLEIHTIRS